MAPSLHMGTHVTSQLGLCFWALTPLPFHRTQQSPPSVPAAHSHTVYRRGADFCKNRLIKTQHGNCVMCVSTNVIKCQGMKANKSTAPFNVQISLVSDTLSSCNPYSAYLKFMPGGPQSQPGNEKAAVYLHKQRFVGWPRRGQTLRLMGGSSVLKCGACKLVSAWPVHGPVSVQVVFSEGIAHRDVGSGHVHFTDVNTPGSRRNGDHRVIL